MEKKCFYNERENFTGLEPLISIIVPLYNTERYIQRCLNSLCRQTYKNIEVIVVNDRSTDGSLNIVKRIANSDVRIRIVNHEYNKGLYHARITGVEHSAGDYIGFVDSDDYVSCDYFSTLLYSAEKNSSDIVVGKIVHENEDGYQYVHNLYSFYNLETLSGDEITEKYWKQEGYCFIWHTIWNKLYSKKIWRRALPVLKKQEQHLIMTEDFLFSSVLFNYAEVLTCVEFGSYVYFKHDCASTSLKGGIEKYRKNISDLGIAFRFVGKFISSKEYRCNVKEHYNNWRNLYVKIWYDNISSSDMDDKSKTEMYHLLAENLGMLKEDLKTPSYFYSATTPYDNRYDKIIKTISSYEYDVISFDVFDTALLRPFYNPMDLFILMNQYFNSMVVNERQLFSEIRVKAEAILRKKAIHNSNLKKEDISIDEIYDEIERLCDMDKKTAEAIRQKEIELEIKYCTVRESVFNIYRIALECGKKIFFTSDMYLGKNTIAEMLNKSGYTKYEDILVSCEQNASKRTGSLFHILIGMTGVEPERIIHIGDCWDSDYISAKNKNISAIFYAKTTDCLLYNISDIKTTHSCCAYKSPSGTTINYEKSLEYLGTRTALALAANKLYDNPFISYNEWSEFNCSPQFLGYYLLGMHLLGFTKWLTEESVINGYDVLAFISRDGFLPMKAYSILQKYYKSAPDFTYIYMSRKSVISCDIKTVSDLYALYGYLNPEKCTIGCFIELISPILNSEKELFEKKNINLDDPIGDYNEFLKTCKYIYENYFDRSKAEKFTQTVCCYINQKISGKSAIVDIGYSGRTQEMIKRITGKEIDAFYVHTNDDIFSIKERQYGFKIRSFYHYTPSITGGIRELLFSEYAPSCIGYSETGEPIKEIFHSSYPENYIISEIQKNAINFINDFCKNFGDCIDIMDMRNIDISYPYEFFLSTLTDFDSKMFECCNFEDDMWAGKTFSLSKYWKDSIQYHKIKSFYSKMDKKSETYKNQEASNIEWDLFYKTGTDKKGKLSKALFWFVVDRELFKSKFRIKKGAKR